MAFRLYRSNRTEALVQQLRKALNQVRQFEHSSYSSSVAPIVVGSRGMERWLRHELADNHPKELDPSGVPIQPAYSFPDSSFWGAAAWLLAGADPEVQEYWAVRSPKDNSRFSVDWLTMRVIGLMRYYQDEKEFAAVRTYLQPLTSEAFEELAIEALANEERPVDVEAGEASEAPIIGALDPVAPSELAFAREVAEVLCRLMHDRPEDALAWARKPHEAPEQHRWLATLLREVGVANEAGSPALIHEQLAQNPPKPTGRHLFVFGFSSLRPGDQKLLAALAHSLEVHLFILSPSEARQQHCSVDHNHIGIEADLEVENPLWGSLGVASRDLQAWLEEVVRGGDKTDWADWVDPVSSRPGEPQSLLQGLQSWVFKRGDCPDLPQRQNRGQSWTAGSAFSHNSSWGLPGEHEYLSSAHHRDPDCCSDSSSTDSDDKCNTNARHPDSNIAEHPPAIGGMGGDLPSFSLHSDYSLILHPTKGPLSQCEVLCDELLAHFDRDPSLQPDDVLVMTPDMETYAPLLAEVFARRGLAAKRRAKEREEKGVRARALDPNAGRIPNPQNPSPQCVPAASNFRSDVGLSLTNPLAKMVEKLLKFASERVKAGRMHELMRLEPIRRRFALGEEDLDTIRHLMSEYGIYCGMGGDDVEVGGRPFFGFGEAEVALEAPIPEPEPSLGDQADIDGVLDFSLLSSLGASSNEVDLSDRRLLTSLASAVSLLTAMRRELIGPHSIKEWACRLGNAMDQLTRMSEDTLWMRAEVDHQLQETVRHGSVLGELKMEGTALLKLLKSQFEKPKGIDDPIPQGVTVCAPQSVQSVPYRVVAMLGMDDGLFPRVGQFRTWDPFLEDRRPGEHDAGEQDCHYFLDALISARERFLILWKDAIPLQEPYNEYAVAWPVEELIDVLVHLTGRSRSEVVCSRLLMPWSSDRCFDARLALAGFRYSKQHQSTSTKQNHPGVGLIEMYDYSAHGARTPEEEMELIALDLAKLAENLVEPQKMFLQERLGIVLPSEDGTADRNDLKQSPIGSLDTWGFGLLDGGAERAMVCHVNAEHVSGQRVAPLELNLEMEPGFTLVGSVRHVRKKNGQLLLEWFASDGEPDELLRMTAWVHLLAAVALGYPVAGARVVGCQEAKQGEAAGHFMVWVGSRFRAKGKLKGLLGIRREARTRPLKLFGRTSSKMVERLIHKSTSIDSMDRFEYEEIETGFDIAPLLALQWAGDDTFRGDREDRWVAALFGNYNPLDDLLFGTDSFPWGFNAISLAVWAALVAAEKAGEASKLAATWAPTGENFQ